MDKYSKILCFDRNTYIKTQNGLLPIKEVKPGTKLYVYDAQSNSLCEDIVTSTACSLHSICAILRFEDGTTLKATIDHPLLVYGKGWCAVNANGIEEMYGVAVKQLEKGDFCLRFENSTIIPSRVIEISVTTCSEPFYCLSTEKLHNFIANGIIAHDVDINRFSDETFVQEGVIVERE